jgi:uncharacterized protein
MTAKPLTDTDYDRLAGILNRFRSARALNLEQLDGFFAALISGPGHIHPSEFLPELWGDEMVDEDPFESRRELKEFLDLVLGHWNVIAETLQSGDVYLPLLLEDEEGTAHGNDWAHGFLRGMDLRRADWAELLHDEEHGGALVPIFALAHEHDPDPTMRPYKEPMSPARREQLIVGMAAGITAVYRYFEPRRGAAARLSPESTSRRETKVGRNDPCPCGSGKKYKYCCGKPTLH